MRECIFDMHMAQIHLHNGKRIAHTTSYMYIKIRIRYTNISIVVGITRKNELCVFNLFWLYSLFHFRGVWIRNTTNDKRINETETEKKKKKKKFARRLSLTHESLKYGACNSIKFQMISLHIWLDFDKNFGTKSDLNVVVFFIREESNKQRI